ncbi:serine/threonine-protein kinase [Adhaeretor mobilis]|uniref:Serine/threonine-protein kinase PknB n=1 Tax=Adhaeretor mobilis TaxID=1930276 RepID=A0A517MY35_9BACT|nr:serine/threonine-protein kinase [Adhaeretor mobilis]QDS99789.1 Serine/threonine-protein kinase PknB [Adhaeretor mobilis]
MSEQLPGSNDETIVRATDPALLDQSSGEASTGDQSSKEGLRKSARRRVALVSDSSPQMSAETRALLRGRLRILAVVLMSGFAMFLVWRLAMAARGEGAVGPAGIPYAHLAVTVLLGLISWKLCAKCDLSLPKLRIAELLIVGSSAAFFFVLGTQRLEHDALSLQGHTHIPNIGGPWQFLIFCYALFVPNTWRRAAVVIGLLALGPLVVIGVVAWQSPAFLNLAGMQAFRGVFIEHALIALMTGVSAVVGVKTIGTLRRDAFLAKQLGQYRLKQLIGSGGMGEVYLAEHEMMKRPCAIKVIRPEKAGDPQVLARFEREVRATAKLSHWNSIDIYDYGSTDDGTFYYVMEYLPGHNLGELVEMHGPLSAGRIVYLMLQVGEALAEAHDQGLVHRDIKPANIFCAYRGGRFDVAKLLDFGLAKPMSDVTEAGLTAAGSITGSPLFMSPEQSTGSPNVDERSDVYSLGAVMYYMATGRPLFEYEQPLRVIVAHASEEPIPPRELCPDLPLELEELILRCLEKQPEDRFQTVAQLLVALEEVPVEPIWTVADAAAWWKDFGCPKRKALARQVQELAAI